MRLPLYFSSTDGRTIRLARCRNCGQIKLSSRPCSFDHLAAILEWNQRHPSRPSFCRQVRAAIFRTSPAFRRQR